MFAVNGLDLSVRPGGLIGPNGPGKTTTINMMTGHLKPSGGHVHERGTRTDGSPANCSDITAEVEHLVARWLYTR